MSSSRPLRELRVTVRFGASTLGTYVLLKDRISIGRASSCDIVVPSGHIARLHGVLERKLDGGGYVMVNLSGEVTHLNGRPIQRAEIRAGDQIAIGELVLAVEDIEVVPAQPLRAETISDLLLVPDGEKLIPVPAAKVLWAATAEEMLSQEVTSRTAPLEVTPAEEQEGEEIFLLTKRKTPLPRTHSSLH